MIGENESVAVTLGQGEGLARSSQPVNYAPGNIFKIPTNHSEIRIEKYDFEGGHNEEDSKQAAEAMVQLSAVGFYNHQGKLTFIIIIIL